MYHLKWLLTYVLIMWKDIICLLCKLACFKYLVHTIHFKFRQTYYNFFRLYRPQSLLFYTANALMQNIYISHNFYTLFKRSSFHLRHVHIQHNHSTHSFALCNQSKIIYIVIYTAAIRIKVYLQTLLNHLPNRNQILLIA